MIEIAFVAYYSLLLLNYVEHDVEPHNVIEYEKCHATLDILGIVPYCRFELWDLDELIMEEMRQKED